MSATPQDFYTWSQLTGNPVPRTAQERMILAPHVRSFVQNIGRQGGYVPQQQSGLRRAVDVIGKTALAAGGLTLAALAGKHYAERGLREVPDVDVRGEGISSPSDTGFTPGKGGLAPGAADGPTPTPTAPRGGPSGGKTYDDPWRGSYATPSVDVGRPAGVTVTSLPQLPPSNEPAEVRMAAAERSVAAGPGPESLAGETNIQLGTPFETPVQRAQGQEDLRMYGQPRTGAVEAFRASPKYAAMREAYPALREEYATEPASLPQVVRESRDVTPPTTAQALNQGAISPVIQEIQESKGAPPGSVERETLASQPAESQARRVAGALIAKTKAEQAPLETPPEKVEALVSQPLAQAERITSSQTFGLGGAEIHPGIERVRNMQRLSGHEIGGDILAGDELTVFDSSLAREIPISHPRAQSILAKHGVSYEDAMAHRLNTFRNAGFDIAAEHARYQAESQDPQTVSAPVAQPVAPASAAVKSRPAGPTAEEARDLMSSLNVSHTHLNRIQRELLRDQLLTEKYNPKPAEETPATVQSAPVSPQAFLSERVGRPRAASVQSVEAQRSQMPSMFVPGKENEPGRIQFHREHGMMPPARAGSSFAFGPQDELSRRLSNVQNLGYDPNDVEKPMWW